MTNSTSTKMKWKFCENFNVKLQDAMPISKLFETENYEPYWLSEDEAKKFYTMPLKDIAIVAPDEEKAGVKYAPYYINVDSGENPSFTVRRFLFLDMPLETLWWNNVGNGRLFCALMQFYDYGNTLGNGQWLPQKPMEVMITNHQDGSGEFMFIDGNDPTKRIRHEFSGMDVSDLYMDVPEWGEWQTLIKDFRSRTPTV